MEGRSSSDDQENGLEQVWETEVREAREKMAKELADEKSTAEKTRDKLSSELDHLQSLMKAEQKSNYVQNASHMQV